MLFGSKFVGCQNGTILVTVLGAALVAQMLVPSNATPVGWVPGVVPTSTMAVSLLVFGSIFDMVCEFSLVTQMLVPSNATPFEVFRYRWWRFDRLVGPSAALLRNLM